MKTPWPRIGYARSPSMRKLCRGTGTWPCSCSCRVISSRAGRNTNGAGGGRISRRSGQSFYGPPGKAKILHRENAADHHRAGLRRCRAIRALRKPLIAARGAGCFSCGANGAAARFLKNADGIDQVVTPETLLAVRCALSDDVAAVSLQHACVDSIPADVPYLRARLRALAVRVGVRKSMEIPRLG